MPSMKLNSGSLDHTDSSPSAPSFEPTGEWSTTLRFQASRSEAVGKRRNTESHNPRQLQICRDLLQSYDMSCLGKSGSATEMFGQMTPSCEEEMHLGDELDNQELLDKQPAPRVPPADTNTPEDSDGVDEEFEFSFEEFEKRYKPLSNLPTPPWSESSPAESSFEGSDGMLNPEFYGAAKYLVTMIPRNAFREPPSVKLLHSILQRANLSLEVMALAGCILDCLSTRFVRQLRSELYGKLSTGSPEDGTVIVVAALCIAMKFMDDSSYSSRYWTLGICEELFSVQEFTTTERLILADLNYSLHGISAPETLQWIMDEIKLYAAQAPVEASNSSSLLPSERPVISSPIDRAPSPFPMLS